MEIADKKEKNTHHGHALKRIRRILGMKQDTLAYELGMTQAMISAYETKRIIEDHVIEQFANVLKITPDLIRELEEDPVTVIIENNTFENGSSNIGIINGDNVINNNPIHQIIELNKEKQTLYERMLTLEREKALLLEKLLKETESEK